MNDEKAYWTHEISKLLSVSDGTIRKWCLELEKQGYTFAKGENNSRAFIVRDYELLLQVKHFIRTDKLTIEKAVSNALNDNVKSNTNDGRSNELEVVRKSFEHELKLMNEKMDKQEEFNKKILERMEERDKNLMAVLNEIQEHKKQLVSAEQSNKKWWKFWK